MSGITGNVDCEECSSAAHVANSTEARPHPAADEDDELLRYIWREYLHPKQYEWVLIVAYIVVFLVSLVGNSLGKLCPWRTEPAVIAQEKCTLSNFFRGACGIAAR